MSAKVLVVDDSRTVRQQVGAALVKAGYEMLEAEDGAQGLIAIAAHRDLALVICDINMPNMNGLDMLAAVRVDASNADLPIVMLTTEGKADLIQRARESGAKGWIVKPFKPDQLVAVVRKIVGH
jgi:two-component system chemotaxis response regulator CheY